jgi:hypothetical protein
MTQQKSRTPQNPLEVHYFEHWDHTNHRLTFDEEEISKYRFFGDDRPTSFEILQAVLHEYYHSGENKNRQKKCLEPDVHATRRLVQQLQKNQTLPFPVLNVGFPKSGSSSIARWFRNTGRTVSHHFVQARNNKETPENIVGLQMLEASRQGLSPFALLPPKHVHAQMDYTGGILSGETDNSMAITIFPQIQLLDEIHAAEPNATFVLLHRPVQDWIESAKKWNRYPFRWAEGDIPGLVLTEQQRYERDILSERIVVNEQQLQDWWCTHVLHIREFVKQYPSHNLIELDLYDGETSSQLLSQLFPTFNTIHTSNMEWTKANSNPKNNVDKGAKSSSSPSRRAVKFFQLWNFTTNTIDIDNNSDGETKTSLEVLQDIVNDQNTQNDLSCFGPDKSVALPPSTSISFPIINVGLPMDPWNDALKDFFSCLGLRVTHRKGHGGKFGSTGKKIKQAILAGMVPLSSYFGERDVYTQLDYTATLNSSAGIIGEDQSVFPQIQLLDEIHEEVPNATFLMPFPNFDDWRGEKFAGSFHNFTERWARMEMPGLVLTEEQKRARSLPCPTELDENGELVGRCLRLSDSQLNQWWCNHVQHVRSLLRNVYPSHTLLELDWKDTESARTTLQIFFPQANNSCLSNLEVWKNAQNA